MLKRFMIAALLIVSGAFLVAGNANAIIVTMDDTSLSVIRPTTGTTIIDFTGHVTLTDGYELSSLSMSSLWKADGTMLLSTFPSTSFLLDGALFSVTVSSADVLGLYAFNVSGGPAYVNFAECPIRGGACNNATVNYALNVVDASVPEPATAALLALGLLGLGISRSRRTRA